MDRSRVTADTRPISAHQAADRLCRRHYQAYYRRRACLSLPGAASRPEARTRASSGSGTRQKEKRRKRSPVQISMWLGVSWALHQNCIDDSGVPPSTLMDDDGCDDADDQSLYRRIVIPFC